MLLYLLYTLLRLYGVINLLNKIVPTQNQIYHIYSKKIYRYHSFVQKVKYEKALTSFFQHYFFEKKNVNHILDAGCGSGILTRSLANSIDDKKFRSLNLTGFDINPAMLIYFSSWIKKNKYRNITLIKTDLLKLEESPINKNNYDLVISSGMLEYLNKTDFVRGIKMLNNTIKKNGKLLIFISKNSLLNFFLMRLWWKANLYTKNELTDALHKAGLKNITFYSFPSESNHMNMWGWIVEATK